MKKKYFLRTREEREERGDILFKSLREKREEIVLIVYIYIFNLSLKKDPFVFVLFDKF